MNVILEALCPYVYNQCPGIKYIIIFAFCKEQAYVVSMHARKQCRNAQETFSFINMFSRTFSKNFCKIAGGSSIRRASSYSHSHFDNKTIYMKVWTLKLLLSFV